MARKPTTTKAADPLDILATGLAADHKVKMASEPKVEATAAFAQDVADTVAAGAINGAGAALDAGGDARDVAAATIGGAAAATAEVDNESAREQVRVESEKPTKLPTPAAPGDEPDTVFTRRLQRLTTLAIEADFETGTAFGNLRDCVLDLFKHRPMLWDAMIPSDKKDLIAHVEGICRDIIGKVVLVIAQGDEDSIQGTLDKKWGVNGETIEMKVKIDNADGDTLVDALKLAGHKIVIVSADSKRFMSAPRDIDPGDDQVAMEFVSDTKPVTASAIGTGFAGEGSRAVIHSSGTATALHRDGAFAARGKLTMADLPDAALADGDETKSGVDKAKDDAAAAYEDGKIKSADPVSPPAEKSDEKGEPDPVEKPFGVYDPEDAEWMSIVPVNGAADGWSQDISEAVAMTEEEAVAIAGEYADGIEAKRLDADD